jgi:N-acetylglucosamine kinase-like BadF-type ATPase
VRASAAGGLALTGGVFTHGDQSAQAFRENYFVATSVHLRDPKNGAVRMAANPFEMNLLFLTSL